jgi:CRP-like cAMP-binding protein
MIDHYNLLEIFRKYLDLSISISERDWKRLTAVTQVVQVPRGELLLSAGEIYDKHVFILKGCLRTYLINEDGKQATVIFKCENSWASEFESLSGKTPSRFNIDAIEPSWVIIIKDTDFIPFYESLPGLKEHIRSLFLHSFMESNLRIHAAYFLDATERYMQLLAQWPQIILRAPQHMIASYLRINAETLSRIKRKTSKHIILNNNNLRISA